MYATPLTLLIKLLKRKLRGLNMNDRITFKVKSPVTKGVFYFSLSIDDCNEESVLYWAYYMWAQIIKVKEVRHATNT